MLGVELMQQVIYELVILILIITRKLANHLWWFYFRLWTYIIEEGSI